MTQISKKKNKIHRSNNLKLSEIVIDILQNTV